MLGTVTVPRSIVINKAGKYCGKLRASAVEKECWGGGYKFKCGINETVTNKDLE